MKRYKLLPLPEVEAKAEKLDEKAGKACGNWLKLEQRLKIIRTEIRVRKQSNAILP